MEESLQRALGLQWDSRQTVKFRPLEGHSLETVGVPSSRYIVIVEGIEASRECYVSGVIMRYCSQCIWRVVGMEGLSRLPVWRRPEEISNNKVAEDKLKLFFIWMVSRRVYCVEDLPVSLCVPQEG